MRFKQKSWAALGVMHLVLVAFGAGHFSFWNIKGIGTWLERYGEYSGSGRDYPFFAPNVGDSVRAEFDLYDNRDRFLGSDSLLPGTNRESDIRMIDLVEYLENDINDENYRRLLAKSWMGKMFAKHPKAVSAVLRVETYDVPTMKEFRNGVRYDWEPIYQATFRRKGVSPSE